MFRSPAKPWRWLAVIVAVSLCLALLPTAALAAGRGGVVTPEDAVAEASRLMGKVRSETRANPRSACARPGWTGAAPGDPLLLHSLDGEPTSYLVPVRGEGGKAVSIIGVSAGTGEWAWHTSVAAPDFPAVDSGEAAARAKALLERRGIRVPLPVPTARTAPDKNVYWCFELEAGPIRQVYVPVFFDGPASADIDGRPWEAGRVENPAVRPVDAPAEIGDPRREAAAARGTATPPAYPGAAPAACDISGVPYHYQETACWCGPASLEMLFDYWGEDIPQKEIADVVNASSSGCYNDDLARAGHFSNQSTAVSGARLRGYTARALGYGVSTANWNSMLDTRYSDLKELVSRGFPVLVLTYYESPPSSGHFRLVKGYNDNLDTFIVHDPWHSPPYQGPDVSFNQSFLVDTLWPYSGRWGMIAVPWSVTVSKPARVAAGQVFQVTARVEYGGWGPMNGQFPVAAGSALATIGHGGAYELVGGNASQYVDGIGATGTSGAVTWTVRSLGAQSTSDISVVAHGVVEGGSSMYPAYSDWIGGSGSGPPQKRTGRTWGHDSLGVKELSRAWYLAEGCTGQGFETWILVQNPGDRAAEVKLTYMTPGGEVEGPTAVIPAESRGSFSVADTVPGEWSVSTMVTSDEEVIAERAMYGAGRTWGHDSAGTPSPATGWYLAEGCTHEGFETWVLVQNPNRSPARVDLTYMTPSGRVDGPELVIPARGRKTVFVADTVPGEWSVSTMVTSDEEVIAERAMYGPGRIWGHGSVGVTAAAAGWYLAEGCTGQGFETWILVQNPGPLAAKVELTYMTPGGARVGPSVTLQPHSRHTFNVADTVPGEWEVSTKVSADRPVVAERAMYGAGRTWGHDSAGTPSPATDWYLAEGCTQEGFETWVLVQNPNDREVTVELTYMTTGGPVDGPSATIPANSRMTFNVAETVPGEWEVSTKVSSRDGGVVVERAMYGGL